MIPRDAAPLPEHSQPALRRIDLNPRTPEEPITISDVIARESDRNVRLREGDRIWGYLKSTAEGSNIRSAPVAEIDTTGWDAA